MNWLLILDQPGLPPGSPYSETVPTRRGSSIKRAPSWALHQNELGLDAPTRGTSTVKRDGRHLGVTDSSYSTSSGKTQEASTGNLAGAAARRSWLRRDTAARRRRRRAQLLRSTVLHQAGPADAGPCTADPRSSTAQHDQPMISGEPMISGAATRSSRARPVGRGQGRARSPSLSIYTRAPEGSP